MKNDFFHQMCKEAIEELASGESGSWRKIDTNVLFMACFGLLYNSLMHKLARPLWWFAGAVSVGVIAYIVSTIFGS